MSQTHALNDISGTRPAKPERRANGQSFSQAQIYSVLVIGAICSLVGPLQPLLLGPLAEAGRLTTQEIGRGAMIEALGMAIAVTVSGAIFKAHRLKLTIMLSSLVSLVANATTIVSSHEVILAARFVNGLSIGVMLWIYVGMLTRVATPGRLVAIFMTMQSVAVLAVSWLLSTMVTARWGASGGYATLAIIGIVTGLLAILAPPFFNPIGSQSRSSFQFPTGRGFVALGAVVMHMAGIMAVWVYAMPLGVQQGLAASLVSNAISASLAAQILGGVAGTIFAQLNFRIALLGSLAAGFAALACLGAFLSGTAFFIAGLAIVAFCFAFSPGFQMPFLIEVDPSRRAAIFIITAQMLGFSTGPALASLFVIEGDVSNVLLVSGLLFAGTATIIFAMTIRQSRTIASEGNEISNGHPPL